MILHPVAGGFVAVSQSAQAFAAFQIAEHWGNRLTPRPAPRAEVLAAVLLHESGWDDRDLGRLDPHGRPDEPDGFPDGEREAAWASSVARAGAFGRYPAHLVSTHVSAAAAADGGDRHAAFLAEQEALRARLRNELAGDARDRTVLAAASDPVNRAVLRLAASLAAHLARGAAEPVLLPGLPRREGSAPLSVRHVAERTYRLHPWPLVGRRLDVSADGRLLAPGRYADLPAFHSAWVLAPSVRLTWTLCAPAEVGR